VVTVRVAFVALFLTVTVAPWTTAPWGSATVPSIDPNGSWEKLCDIPTQSVTKSRISILFIWISLKNPEVSEKCYTFRTRPITGTELGPVAIQAWQMLNAAVTGRLF
jgi:hypothetical protein